MEDVNIPECLLYVFLIFTLGYIYSKIDPKVDWNYETGDRLLWYNNPFDHYRRSSVKLWTTKN